MEKIDKISRATEWEIEDEGFIILMEIFKRLSTEVESFQWQDIVSSKHSIKFDTEEEAMQHLENSESIYHLFNGA